LVEVEEDGTIEQNAAFIAAAVRKETSAGKLIRPIFCSLPAAVQVRVLAAGPHTQPGRSRQIGYTVRTVMGTIVLISALRFFRLLLLSVAAFPRPVASSASLTDLCYTLLNSLQLDWLNSKRHDYRVS
jgi:hypothetical protein